VVYHAIQAGYRLLDGAGDYGNEKEAGEGVRRAIADGLVKREDICMPSGFEFQDRTADQVLLARIVITSKVLTLHRLGLVFLPERDRHLALEHVPRS